jgi:enamine deaminase RidA (YjgF/YER057c/UK114 family)
MNIRHTPDTIAAPFGPYSHAVEVLQGSRLLYISGEVGALPDGTVPEGSRLRQKPAGETSSPFLQMPAWESEIW